MATLLQIRNRVKTSLGNKGNINDDIDNAINEAMFQLIWEQKPHEAINDLSFTTADGDYDYNFSDDLSDTEIYAPYLVFNSTDSYMLLSGSFEEFLRTRNDDASGGRSSKWCRYKNNIILYKSIPGSTEKTIEVYYVKRLTKLAEPTDVFPLNDEWIYPVEELATAIMFNRLKQFPAAEAHYGAYRAAVGARDTPTMVDQEAPQGGFIFVSNPVDNRPIGESK